MSAGWIVLLVVGGLVVVAALWLVVTYNSLVRTRNQVRNSWSQIDVQLKRRHDLIPNLVETAKGYMEHERETLEEVTRARNMAQQASGPGEAGDAEQRLSNALGQFFLVVERYPDLKANQNFLALQEELTSTENKIGFARQFYNDQVMGYNTRLESFPINIVAGLFRFQPRSFFEVEVEAEREVPEVSF
jgi:LemA protein